MIQEKVKFRLNMITREGSINGENFLLRTQNREMSRENNLKYLFPITMPYYMAKASIFNKRKKKHIEKLACKIRDYMIDIEGEDSIRYYEIDTYSDSNLDENINKRIENEWNYIKPCCESELKKDEVLKEKVEEFQKKKKIVLKTIEELQNEFQNYYENLYRFQKSLIGIAIINLPILGLTSLDKDDIVIDVEIPRYESVIVKAKNIDMEKKNFQNPCIKNSTLVNIIGPLGFIGLLDDDSYTIDRVLTSKYETTGIRNIENNKYKLIGVENWLKQTYKVENSPIFNGKNPKQDIRNFIVGDLESRISN